MQTVFIAGSIAISRIDKLVQERIAKAVTSGLSIVVGDADGADTSIQRHLLSIDAENVRVFCTGDSPRNNVGSWPVENIYTDSRPGTRNYFTAKDLKMAEIADYGLMVWDAKSTGTLSNVLELLRQNKKTVVFVNKNKTFLTIRDRDSFLTLMEHMTDAAKVKADQKIGLFSKIDSIDHGQFLLI